ncbi:hypothetical protein GCM10009868_06830 [Terrabacter aerolatus]|uniref:ANTAR domain-containing protein n=1 Tax=Terrabacter aerolatus TaxID=422442 RepID=A0A512D127_9MICO|nr:ANTAR domain-containing protein [Terrabacter aerolatus]GEO30173.1 hypothetical protein TAE01_19830 [Terrabacter aerolatus]
MSDRRPATAAVDASLSTQLALVSAAARQVVGAQDLEQALAVAASAIGTALSGEAVLRVTAAEHDLIADSSGVVPPSALPPWVRAALTTTQPNGVVGAAGRKESQAVGGPEAARSCRHDPDERGLLLDSSSGLSACRAWVATGRTIGPGVAQRLVAELLLHCLAQSVDRIVTVERVRHNEANLERAVDSNRLVGQAMGILIERHRIMSEEAFEVLRRTSQDHNVKLREVARRVIETGAEPDEVV